MTQRRNLVAYPVTGVAFGERQRNRPDVPVAFLSVEVCFDREDDRIFIQETRASHAGIRLGASLVISCNYWVD